MIYIIIIVAYLVILFLVENGTKPRIQRGILVLFCFALTIIIGLRTGWPDEAVYIAAFNQVPTIFDFSFSENPFGYDERGYYFLASIVKTVTTNSVVYLTVMGGLSMYLLYRSLEKFCLVPLIGFCDYAARFLLNRDFIQIRSSLAILLIVLGVKYIYERNAVKFFLIVALAYSFHHMALLAVPMYFLNMIKIRKQHIVVGLILAMIVSQILAPFISGFVEEWSADLQYTTYVQGNYVSEALGLRNPMIYFQMAILLWFTFAEESLKKYKYYYLFRTGYFYSTIILIVFCNYTALSGRTSTLFATLEMFIIPMIAFSWRRRFRIVYYLGVGLVLSYFFMLKYSEAMSIMGM